MSIEAALAELTAATNRNSDLLERVVAGQEAAMAKLEGGAAPRKPRATRAADPAPEGNAAPAATESPAAVVETASDASTPVAAHVAVAAGIGTDAEKMKAFITGWTGSTEDAAERAARVDLLRGIAASLGVEAKFGELTKDTPKVVFLVERAKALGTAAVDPKADYDYDGSASQEVAAADSGSDF